MNEHLRPNRLPGTTQAAEGLPRRRWSVAEIEAMVAKGIIQEDERFELIGGEVVPMSPKGARHEMVKIALNSFFQRVAPDHLGIAHGDHALRLDKDEFYEPDFLFWPRRSPSRTQRRRRPSTVEVADSSIGYDLGIKAPTYARLGLPEYWVINARTLVNVDPSASPGPPRYPTPRKADRRS